VTALLFGSISTLADTSELQRDAFNQAFSQHGLDWQWDQDDYRARLAGNGGQDRITAYAEERGEQVDAAAVHATKSRIFQESVAEHAQARPGLVDTVKAAKAQGYKVALVTTTTPENVAALGAALAGELSFDDDLDLIVDNSQVDANKPDPAAYTMALADLGEKAEDCVAVEDNPGGVKAAQAAGITCVAFPNTNTAGLDFDGAQVRDRLDLADLTGLIGR